MVGNYGHFVWYELLTTDIDAAERFYAALLGWSARDASTPRFSYRLLASADVPVCGLMALPGDALRSGAAPRWAGYVAVADVDAAADRLAELGGRIYVPPTESNIGRVAVVADAQTAPLGLIGGLKLAVPQAAADAVGRVGWHELFASDGPSAFNFYHTWLGWQAVAGDAGSFAGYQLFSTGADAVGGIFTKLPRVPFPFWLHYFNVADIGAASRQVAELGGQVVQGPLALPDGIWIARCIDPQGAMFALQGNRLSGPSEVGPAVVNWAAEWGGFASRGRIVSAPRAAKSGREKTPPVPRKPPR